jgi:hypothetical protein
MRQNIAVPNFGRASATACVRLLCVWHHIPFDPSLESRCVDQDDGISAEELISLARHNGFDAVFTQQAWPSLIAELSREPMLLLLKNGNSVLALENEKRARGEEIVISDPLYRSGESCLLPRVSLEKAWAGVTVKMRRRHTKGERVITRCLAGCSVGLLLLAGCLFIKTSIEFSSFLVSGMDVSSDAAGVTHEPLGPTGSSEKSDTKARVSAGYAALMKLPGTATSIRARNSFYGPTPSTPAKVVPDELEPTSTTSTSKLSINGTSIHSGLSNHENAGESDDTMQSELTPTNQNAVSRMGDESQGRSINIVALVTRGDSAFANGDIAIARLFYQRAADAADAEAAVRLAETYDPRFLTRTNMDGLRANSALAAYWYRRARDLGAEGAETALRDLPSQ